MLQKSVSAIHGSSDGGIWIAFYSGDIQHYNANTQKFTTFPKRLFPNIKNGIRCIMDDGNDHLYIGLRMDGMYVYNLRTKRQSSTATILRTSRACLAITFAPSVLTT